MFQGVSLVAVIMALVQLAKGLKLPTALAPLLAALLGIAAGYFLLNDWFMGVVLGLTAAGLYDFGTKTLIGGLTKSK